ncbi:MAG: cardiolipin synthase [Rhizobacter sp.]|nr:cardiolipin synthase [Bacteriovorax sp.]
MAFTRKSKIILATSLITVFLCVLILNLKSPGKRIEHVISSEGALDSPVVMKSIGELLGPPLIPGNKVTHLENGDEIFSSMLSAIKSAKQTITFETFIYWEGIIGENFSHALSEKAKSGVKVHIILDWIGSRRMEQKSINEMIESGVQVKYYHQLRWYNVTRINNRTHRKILVIDGRIGFTGGVGIADEWSGNAQDKNHWRDSHFKIQGPVVNQMQAAFMDNWNKISEQVLDGDKYFPVISKSGNSTAQVFKSSPEEGSGSVRLMYLYSIVHAKKSILIANAYFVPDSYVIKLLIEAARRGVKIEVIVPGTKIDTAITRMASMATWGELLEAGINIYQYQPTMYHCKYMIVDDLWVSVGSTNMDNRSFRLNDEANLNIIDNKWAHEMVETFSKDRSLSEQMTLAEWNKRPLLSKLLEHLSFLFSSQM